MSIYNRKEWKEFRDNVIESDGFRCTNCGRPQGEVVLQVHHKRYIPGKRPWEYATEDCETLCKGCHAAEHGIIKPKVGWEYLGEYDLEDLVGTCENCGTPIRYVYQVGHENWGFMEVGTLCCDNLTDTEIASNNREALNRYRGRKKRFVKSKRWKFEEGMYLIKQSLFEVQITGPTQEYFQLTIHNLKSKTKYKTLEEAKEAAFETIESGSLYDYLDKYSIEYPKKTTRKSN
ncbi:MAG: hypothetical protein Roseis2KO_32940 [Roseivirga sp.]